MGTLNWTVSGYGTQGGKNAMSFDETGSGAFTTTTSAATVTGLIMQRGQVVKFDPSVDMWVRGGGNVAAVGTGFFIRGGQSSFYECKTEGAVSAIDAA